MKNTIYSKDGLVYGRIVKNKDSDTFIAYRISEKGYWNEGKDCYIGEYTTHEIAEEKLNECVHSLWESRKKYKEETEKMLNKKWWQI